MSAATADDLVTEEMIKVARAAYEQIESYEFCMIALEDAIRAVAPLIAERVAEVDAQIANSMDIYGHIAADIRARWEGRP
jgi:hypothetical protein